MSWNWRNEKDWWKAPVLQGEENDYGDLDYLIEELPQDTQRWLFSWREPYKCEATGKYTHLILRSTSHFRTMDGWDSFCFDEGWRSILSTKILRLKKKIKRPFKIYLNTIKLCVCYCKTYVKNYGRKSLTFKVFCDKLKKSQSLVKLCMKNGQNFDIEDWR